MHLYVHVIQVPSSTYIICFFLFMPGGLRCFFVLFPGKEIILPIWVMLSSHGAYLHKECVSLEDVKRNKLDHVRYLLQVRSLCNL